VEKVCNHLELNALWRGEASCCRDHQGNLKTSFAVSPGEELGWRGYLVPRLESLGRWITVLVSGILHGI
jgi:hypothetical protein